MLRWIAVLGMIAFATPNASAGCCGAHEGPTSFRQEPARFIVFGTIGNPQKAGGLERTDFFIQTRLRDHPDMKGKTSLVLPYYFPIEKKNYPPQYVLFCDVVTKEKEVEPYIFFIVHRAATLEYIKKALALDASDPVRNLVFFFGHLDDPDPVVARDAFKELSQAKDTDIGAAGRKLNPAKIRQWLRDPKTPESRTALYAKLLAAAGTTKDGKLLLTKLEDRTRKSTSGLDSILVAYLMLAPKDGWAYTLAILDNPGEEVARRYAAVRALRYLAASRTGVVSKRQITKAYCLLFAQDDIVDLAIEDLRKWKRWDLADVVLRVIETNAYKLPIVRRSILRYAIQCKGSAGATAYVAARRKADKEAVDDAQELLDLEAEHAKFVAETPK
jgi:hypothetical protein